MKVQDLFEDEWENIPPSSNKMADIRFLKTKKSSLQHQEEILDQKFENAQKTNPNDMFVQNFPVDDVEDVIPPQVFKDIKAFTKFDMIGTKPSGEVLGKNRIYVRNTRPELVALAKIVATKMPELVRKQYEIDAQIKARWRQGQKQS